MELRILRYFLAVAEVRPFEPALRSDVYLAWKKGAPPNHATQALIAQVRESAGSLTGR